jgi:hypothetical protein
LEELQAGDPPQIGPYLLVGRLGAGGMGQVYLGRSPGGRLMAVKVIRAELAGDPGFRARFAREVAAARKVSGVFTAAVVDADPTAVTPWLVTGFVNGLSLAEAVAGRGPLPAASVLALAAGLAEGLGAVHAAGVVHRDLKPSNVLLAADGPRVIDFGISQAAGAPHLTRTGMVIGSPAYMSPEQVEGRPVGPAGDVFSLGAVLAFAATGEGPFGAGAPATVLYRVVHGTPRLDRLPRELQPLAGRCLAKDPGQWPTAAQFLAELTAAHPAAANLTDWLPASILPGTPPFPAPAATRPPAASASGPPAPDAAWPPTVTAAAQDPPGPMSPVSPVRPPGAASPVSPPGAAERQDADVPLPAPAVGVHAPGAPAAGRRRRRRAGSLIALFAAAAVLGAIIGLMAVAPWKHPPVLRPAGLVADSSSVGSVAFRWSGPATGPAPDRYEIVRDGRPVGSVPGNVTFYRDAGLAPDSSYRFQVIAIRGGKHSPTSAVLALATQAPPVSDAVLDGKWGDRNRVTSVVSADPAGWTVGARFTDTWTFTPACAAGPCDVTLAGTFDGAPFTSVLARAGAVYTGTARVDTLDYCNTPSNHMHDTLHFRIQVQDAGVRAQAWKALTWSGTVTVDIAYDPVGSCSAGTVMASVSSG